MSWDTILGYSELPLQKCIFENNNLKYSWKRIYSACEHIFIEHHKLCSDIVRYCGWKYKTKQDK